MPRSHCLQGFAADLCAGPDAHYRRRFYRDAECSCGTKDRTRVNPARRHGDQDRAGGGIDTERHDSRGNDYGAQVVARKTWITGCRGPGGVDGVGDDRMKLLSSLQWRLFGYLRRYLFPYVLLLGIA